MTPQQDTPQNGTQTALVTGANKGIGKQTVRALAALGWNVWLGARDTEAGETARAEIEADGPPGSITVLPVDVTDDTSVAEAVRTVQATGAGLDVLINNAGISGRRSSVEETTPADFRDSSAFCGSRRRPWGRDRRRLSVIGVSVG